MADIQFSQKVYLHKNLFFVCVFGVQEKQAMLWKEKLGFIETGGTYLTRV